MPRTASRSPARAAASRGTKGGSRSRSASPSRTQLVSAFKGYDFDGNGEITLEELQVALRRLAKSDPSIRCDDASVRRMLEKADVDGSGGISQSEFLAVMAAVEAAQETGGNWHAMMHLLAS